MDKVKIEVSGDARELVLREGHAPEIFVFNGRKFVAGSHKSFVELVKSKASKANAVVAYNESGAKCIIDDTVVNMPFETILYAYQPSIQAKEWGKILSNDGKVFEHKQIIDFLKIRTDDEIPIIEALLNGVRNFKYALKISGDYTFDDRNNYTVAIAIGETEGTIRIPTLIELQIELFEESDFKQIFEIEIEIIRPKSENEKPLFRLSCPKYLRYEKEAKDNILEKIKTDLAEYLVVAGSI